MYRRLAGDYVAREHVEAANWQDAMEGGSTNTKSGGDKWLIGGGQTGEYEPSAALDCSK
jgi:hypothetical protein